MRALTHLPLCLCVYADLIEGRLEVAVRRCSDAVACLKLKCDDACRASREILGTLVPKHTS